LRRNVKEVKCHFYHTLWMVEWNQYDLMLLMLTSWCQYCLSLFCPSPMSYYILWKEMAKCSLYLKIQNYLLILWGHTHKIFLELYPWEISLLVPFNLISYSTIYTIHHIIFCCFSAVLFCCSYSLQSQTQ
jgi:hypothetical protein